MACAWRETISTDQYPAIPQQVQQLPRVDSQVSALSVEQLLSYDSITVSRSDHNHSENKFRLTADTVPATLKVRPATFRPSLSLLPQSRLGRPSPVVLRQRPHMSFRAY